MQIFVNTIHSVLNVFWRCLVISWMFMMLFTSASVLSHDAGFRRTPLWSLLSVFKIPATAQIEPSAGNKPNLGSAMILNIEEGAETPIDDTEGADPEANAAQGDIQKGSDPEAPALEKTPDEKPMP